jgi:hypothetical protein
MSVFDDEPVPPSRRRSMLLLVFLGAVAVAGSWLVLSRPEPATRNDTIAREAPARPRPSPRREPVPSGDTTPAATDRPAPAREPAEPTAPPAAAPSGASGVLRVRSDVPGAAVFLDRKFLGNTPLDVDGLAAGSHRLNVSVDGYEGHAQAVDIGATPADVDVRFKDVRLHASVPVVHKHGVGSCSGQLAADPAGLRYETANREDAFTLRFEDVDIFVVDYLKKSLRVKRRGGRTWNFEDPKAQADPLFVFHRDVEKARARLAAK